MRYTVYISVFKETLTLLMNCIIATYPGQIPDRKNYWDPYSLQIVLAQFLRIFREKVETKQQCLVKQLTIVQPLKLSHPRHPNYYERRYWTRKFKPYFNQLGIKLVYLPYKEENLYYSYGQWIHAIKSFPEYKYHMVMEDDYCISGCNFDLDLVKEYDKTFPSGRGYLVTLFSRMGKHPLHAAISNGLITYDTIRKFDIPMLDKYLKQYNHIQLAFSYMLSENQVPIWGLENKYRAWFWDSYFQIPKLYNPDPLICQENNATQDMFVPLQLYPMLKHDFLHECLQIHIIKGNLIDALVFRNRFFILESDIEKSDYLDFIMTRDMLASKIKDNLKISK